MDAVTKNPTTTTLWKSRLDKWIIKHLLRAIVFKGYGSITQKPLSKDIADNMVQEVTRL